MRSACRATVSTLFTTAMTRCSEGILPRTAWSSGPKRSASTTNNATSASRAAWVARRLRVRCSTLRARACWPGASTNTNWQPGCVTMPVTRWRVVCGLRETIESFWPTRRFSRLDLPVFGRPASPIVPQRWVISPSFRGGSISPVSLLQSFQHSLCGLLLGALARGSGPEHAQLELRNVALHLEGLLVRLALHRDDAVLRQPPVPSLQDLLQAGLGVLGRPLRIEALDQRTEGGEHRFARLSVAAIEEHRAQHRLERVGEDRGRRLG